jgi:molecular chaperone GrpE (heat shock protein)
VITLSRLATSDTYIASNQYMFQQQTCYEEVLENKIKSLHHEIERLKTELKASEANMQLIAKRYDAAG